MKKTLALLMAFCMTFALVACDRPASDAANTHGDKAAASDDATKDDATKDDETKDDETTNADDATSGSSTSGAQGVMAQARQYYRDGKQDKAFDLFLKQAELGNDDAMISVAYMYIYGEGVSTDYAKAMEWYQKAIDEGNSAGMVGMGVMYDYGYGVEQDKAKAIEWYKMAADAGNQDAMYNLGDMYDNGDGVEKDEAKAREWYEKAADAGSATAMLSLGKIYMDGRGVEKDPVTALDWVTQAMKIGIDESNPIIDEAGGEVRTIVYSAIQGVLKHLGYSCEVTGDTDEATRAAIRAFRTDNNLGDTDTADLGLMEKMVEVAQKA